MTDTPFLYWYWDGPESRQRESDDDNSDEDILHLIFGMWFSQITRFEIKVDREDETRIRLWIRKHQRKVAV
jgi:hypothetical protein